MLNMSVRVDYLALRGTQKERHKVKLRTQGKAQEYGKEDGEGNLECTLHLLCAALALQTARNIA